MATRRLGLLPQIILQDVIFEKFKGPCGHDNPRFGALVHFFAGVIFEKFKGPCGHDNPSFGAFVPNQGFRCFWNAIFGKFRGLCRHGTGRSGRLPQIIFAGCHS